MNNNVSVKELIIGSIVGTLFPPITLIVGVKGVLDGVKEQKKENNKIHWALNEQKKYPMGFYYEGRA